MSENKILQVLKFKNIATVGFSKDPTKPSHQVPKFLIEHGYNVIPVNPTVDEILGRKSYPSIMQVPDQIDVVQVFRPSSEVPKIVQEVIERKKQRGDVKAIWLQEGIRNDEAAKLAEENGLIVIQDRCMYKEYVKKIMGKTPEPLTNKK
ncbi:MAG: CoA-binding protein [Candidatus Aramenus sp.]|jgi:predicted CoA-binding protein|nr:CoA-binding protein [Candidatus Aramenus sp.]